MPIFSFNSLIEKFGEVVAWHTLVEIERAALIQPRRDVADPEARLAHALRMQDLLATTSLAA